MKHTRFVVVLLGTTALIPISAMAQTNASTGQPTGNAQSGTASGSATQAQAKQTGSQANQQGPSAGELRNQALYSREGQEMGRVNNLVRDRQGRIFLIVLSGNGQFLAPADRLQYDNDRFVLTGVTGIENLPAYNRQVAVNYNALAPDHRVTVMGYDAEAGMAASEAQQAEASRVVV
jgi:hypothetical protein